jgi:hypothetical protein
MLDTLSKSDFSLHIFPPFQREGEWYGSAVLRIGGHDIKLMASASEQLLRNAYELASRHVSYGPDVSGCEGCSPAVPTTFVGRLADLAPYIPTQGLAPHARSACMLLLRASQGCASCVDRLQHINELAAKGDSNGVQAKTIVNGLLSMALVRKGAVQSVGRMNAAQFESFLRQLQ